MIYVDKPEEAEGRWVNDNVRLLTAPRYDMEAQRWTALANAYGMLAIIELKVAEPQGPSHNSRGDQ